MNTPVNQERPPSRMEHRLLEHEKSSSTNKLERQVVNDKVDVIPNVTTKLASTKNSSMSRPKKVSCSTKCDSTKRKSVAPENKNSSRTVVNSSSVPGKIKPKQESSSGQLGTTKNSVENTSKVPQKKGEKPPFEKPLHENVRINSSSVPGKTKAKQESSCSGQPASVKNSLELPSKVPQKKSEESSLKNPCKLHENVRMIQQTHPDLILPLHVLHLNLLPTIRLSHTKVKRHIVKMARRSRRREIRLPPFTPEEVNRRLDVPEKLPDSMDECKMLLMSSLGLIRVEHPPSTKESVNPLSANTSTPEMDLVPPISNLISSSSLTNTDVSNSVANDCSPKKAIIKSEENNSNVRSHLILSEEDLVIVKPCLDITASSVNMVHGNDTSAAAEDAVTDASSGQFVLPNDLELKYLPLENDCDMSVRNTHLISKERSCIEQILFELATFMSADENLEIDFEFSLFQMVEKLDTTVCIECKRVYLPIGHLQESVVMDKKCRFCSNSIDSIDVVKKEVDDHARAKTAVVKLLRMEDDEAVSELLPMSYVMIAKYARQTIARKRIRSSENQTMNSFHSSETNYRDHEASVTKKRRPNHSKKHKCARVAKKSTAGVAFSKKQISSIEQSVITEVPPAEKMTAETILSHQRKDSNLARSQLQQIKVQIPLNKLGELFLLDILTSDKNCDKTQRKVLISTKKFQTTNTNSLESIQNDETDIREGADSPQSIAFSDFDVESSDDEIINEGSLTKVKHSVKITSGDVKKQMLAEADYVWSMLENTKSENDKPGKLKCTILEPTDFIYLESAANGKIIFKNAAIFLSMFNKIPIKLSAGSYKIKALVAKSDMTKSPENDFEFKDMQPVSFKAATPKHKQTVEGNILQPLTCSNEKEPETISLSNGITKVMIGMEDSAAQQQCAETIKHNQGQISNLETKENNVLVDQTKNNIPTKNPKIPKIRVRKNIFNVNETPQIENLNNQTNEISQTKTKSTDDNELHPRCPTVVSHSSRNMEQNVITTVQNSISKPGRSKKLTQGSKKPSAKLKTKNLEKQTKVKSKVSAVTVGNCATVFDQQLNEDDNPLPTCLPLEWRTNYSNSCWPAQNRPNVISNVSQILDNPSTLAANHIVQNQSVHFSTPTYSTSAPPINNQAIPVQLLRPILTCDNHRNQGADMVVQQNSPRQYILHPVQPQPIVNYCQPPPMMNTGYQQAGCRCSPCFQSHQQQNVYPSNILNNAPRPQNQLLHPPHSFNGFIMPSTCSQVVQIRHSPSLNQPLRQFLPSQCSPSCTRNFSPTCETTIQPGATGIVRVLTPLEINKKTDF